MAQRNQMDEIIILDLSGQQLERFEFPKISRRKLFANRFKKKRLRVFPPKKIKQEIPLHISQKDFVVEFD